MSETITETEAQFESPREQLLRITKEAKELCERFHYAERRAKAIENIRALKPNREIEVTIHEAGHLGASDVTALEKQIKNLEKDGDLIVGLENPYQNHPDINFEEGINAISEGTIDVEQYYDNPDDEKMYAVRLAKLLHNSQIPILIPDPHNAESVEYANMSRKTDVIYTATGVDINTLLDANLAGVNCDKASRFSRNLSMAESLAEKTKNISNARLLFHVGEHHSDIKNILTDGGMNVNTTRSYSTKTEPTSFFDSPNLEWEVSEYDKKLLLAWNLFQNFYGVHYLPEGEDLGQAEMNEDFKYFVEACKLSPTMLDELITRYYETPNTIDPNSGVPADRYFFVYNYFQNFLTTKKEST